MALPIPDEDIDFNFTKVKVSENVALPQTQLLKLKVGYDDSFLGSFASKADMETYLNAMLTHVQAHYCLEALGSKVQTEVQ